ncbi:hypothetical protein J6590_054035 [Homalodisca vitripennis]|nr:hypothetical protein J6590_054035 [Homalodisca vitripennis]
MPTFIYGALCDIIKTSYAERVSPIATFSTSDHVPDRPKCDLTSEKLEDLVRDLWSRKYRSEMPLAISAGFSDATPQFWRKIPLK